MTDRRLFLTWSLATLSLAPLLSACATTDTPEREGVVALLLPATGPFAPTGELIRSSVQQRLAQAPVPPELLVLDSGETVEMAERAARAALEADADAVIGPVFSDQSARVADLCGAQVPVFSLSNDASLRREGLHLFGVTPRQSCEAVLRYARRQGVRRLRIEPASGAWGRSVTEAARQAADDLGITLLELGSPVMPDAVLIPDDAAGQTSLIGDWKMRGVQCLATNEAILAGSEGLDALPGIWIAGLDLSDLRQARKPAPQTVAFAASDIFAAIAQDAAEAALSAIETPQALASPVARSGVAGRYIFTGNGQLARDMAIYVADGGAVQLVARVPFRS